MNLPPVEPNRAKRWLRRVRACCEAVEKGLQPHRLWMRVVVLSAAAGALVVSIRIFGWAINIASVLSAVIAGGASIGVVSATIRIVDDLLRSHVGGLKKISKDTLAIPRGYTAYTVDADSPALLLAGKFADRFYLGTMAAGAGITVDSRVRNRIELWKQHIKVHPGALSIAVSDEGELAAVALGYLLDSGTLQLAREGRMDYTRLVPGQQIADNEDERYGVYIAVTIGDHAHLKRLERNGSDLVGALLARHIAGLIGFSNLSLDRAVLITDGFRGLSLRAYMRKGFRKIGTKNPHGYPVLELNMSESQHEPFVIAIREAQVLERMASYSE